MCRSGRRASSLLFRRISLKPLSAAAPLRYLRPSCLQAAESVAGRGPREPPPPPASLLCAAVVCSVRARPNAKQALNFGPTAQGRRHPACLPPSGAEPCLVPAGGRGCWACRSQPEMDGVGSSRTMSYSRWSYNRYRLCRFFVVVWVPLWPCRGYLQP